MDHKPRAREDIAQALTAAIQVCVENSGDTLGPLKEDQCPLTTIKGFDSLCGIEVTVELQERLRLKLEDNIFVENNGGRPKARTLKQVIDALVKATKSETK